MNKVLLLVTDCAVAYIDDIIIFNHVQGEHLEHLRRALQCLGDSQLNCRLRQSWVRYLGSIVVGRKVCTQPDKVQALAQATEAQDKKGLQWFGGLTRYYRRFIPHFASWVVSLTAILKKGQPKTKVIP